MKAAFVTFTLLALLAIAGYVEGKRILNRQGGLKEGLKFRPPPARLSDIKPLWFDQWVDHFDPFAVSTFKQQYFVNTQYYKPGGPVFILLGGEGPIAADDVEDHFILPIYAAKFNALIVSVEHRFYGQSIPTADLSTRNLRLLTSSQALADYASFLEFILRTYATNTTKVISFGGSYSGSLSAWFRLRYPHLVTGSIATSAPVRAKLDFPEYMEVVQQSVGPQCAQRIRNVTNIVTNLLKTPSGKSRVEAMFNVCTPIGTPNDLATFFSSLSDGICEIVQYNQDNNKYIPYTITQMCGMLLQGVTDNEVLEAYAKFNNLFNVFSGSTCTWTNYDQMIQMMQSTDPTDPVAAARSWTWQTCTEFGYYQSASSAQQPFSSTITLGWYLQQCNDIFGVALVPDIDNTNAQYGSTNIASSKIVFPNGSIDPWHALGILVSPCKDEPASFMKGTAHCADLYPPRASDVPDLTATRNLEVQLIASWLQDTC